MHSWSVLEFTHSHRLKPKKKIWVRDGYCFLIQLFVCCMFVSHGPVVYSVWVHSITQTYAEKKNLLRRSIILAYFNVVNQFVGLIVSSGTWVSLLFKGPVQVENTTVPFPYYIPKLFQSHLNQKSSQNRYWSKRSSSSTIDCNQRVERRILGSFVGNN